MSASPDLRRPRKPSATVGLGLGLGLGMASGSSGGGAAGGAGSGGGGGGCGDAGSEGEDEEAMIEETRRPAAGRDASVTGGVGAGRQNECKAAAKFWLGSRTRREGCVVCLRALAGAGASRLFFVSFPGPYSRLPFPFGRRLLRPFAFAFLVSFFLLILCPVGIWAREGTGHGPWRQCRFFFFWSSGKSQSGLGLDAVLLIYAACLVNGNLKLVRTTLPPSWQITPYSLPRHASGVVLHKRRRFLLQVPAGTAGLYGCLTLSSTISSDVIACC